MPSLAACPRMKSSTARWRSVRSSVMGKNLFTFRGKRKPWFRLDCAISPSHGSRRQPDQALAWISCVRTATASVRSQRLVRIQRVAYPAAGERWHNPPVPLPPTRSEEHNFLPCLIALCVLFALPARPQTPPTPTHPPATPIPRPPLVVVPTPPSYGCR